MSGQRASRKPETSHTPRQAAYTPEVLRLLYDQSLIAAGAPPATPEFLFARDIKRRWRIDRAWPELRLAVEFEGGVWSAGRHTRPSGYLRDIEKYNELALRGYLLLRVTYDMIADGTATALTLRALAHLAALTLALPK